MIAANRLKDYPVRIVYERKESEPMESSPVLEGLFVTLGLLTAGVILKEFVMLVANVTALVLWLVR